MHDDMIALSYLVAKLRAFQCASRHLRHATFELFATDELLADVTR